MQVLASGNVTEYFNIFEYYIDKFNKTNMTLSIFLQFTIVITIGFIIRGYLLVKFEKQKISEEDLENDRLLKNTYIYCAGHVAYEWVIGYIIAYFVVKLSGSNDKLYAVNMLLAPAIGFLLAMLFDNKIIMKLEDSNSVANMNKPKHIEDKSTLSTPHNTSNENHSVVINVNNGTDGKDKVESIVDGKDSKSRTRIDKLDTNIENCDAAMAAKVISKVNDVIDRETYHDERILYIESQLNSVMNNINILKEIEMNDKKLELKSLIYKCLNNGFATPEENDEITVKYQSYISLGGNHEVEALYENHYLALSVHEDRRKGSASNNGLERRNHHIPYGSFDDEIIIKEEKPLG